MAPLVSVPSMTHSVSSTISTTRASLAGSWILFCDLVNIWPSIPDLPASSRSVLDRVYSPYLMSCRGQNMGQNNLFTLTDNSVAPTPRPHFDGPDLRPQRARSFSLKIARGPKQSQICFWINLCRIHSCDGLSCAYYR